MILCFALFSKTQVIEKPYISFLFNAIMGIKEVFDMTHARYAMSHINRTFRICTATLSLPAPDVLSA